VGDVAAFGKAKADKKILLGVLTVDPGKLLGSMSVCPGMEALVKT